MTHDLSVLYDIEKALGEISKECTTANKSAECLSFELHGAGITYIDENQHKQYNEYTRLFETIYDYALSRTTATELFIGNTMRRVLEAFSTFVYKKGVAEISQDVTILSAIQEDKRNYFQNLMYRLVLNGESHYEEHVYGVQDMAFFGHISPVEKQRTARDILCLMYQLNKNHVLAHLPDAKPEIDGWLASIGGTGS